MTAVESYFGWLVTMTGQPGRGREEQLRVMFDTPFAVLLRRDADRVWYGKDIRRVWWEDFAYGRFSDEERDEVFQRDCSCLEVLLGLSKYLGDSYSDIAMWSQVGWFWLMVKNLGVGPKTRLSTVQLKLDKWIYREFDADGTGSPWPLKNAKEDQRGVDLWYQTMAYLVENNLY